MVEFQNYYTFLIIPLVTTLLLIFTTRNSHLPKIVRGLIALTPLIILILAMGSYLLFYFVGGGINEMLLYHLQTGFGEMNSLKEFYPLILLAIAILLIGGVLTFISYRYLMRRRHKRYSSLFLLALFPIILFHPLILDIKNAHATLTAKPSEEEKLLFDKSNHLLVAEEIPLLGANAKHKNIVLVFLEGIERSFYENEELFPNLMPNLKKIAKENIEFTSIRQLPITSNTITGTVASQCSVPLINRDTGHERRAKNTFLPRAYCLSDLLTHVEYRSIFITGYNKNFTGKEDFYTQHGVLPEDVFEDKDIIKSMPKDRLHESWNGGTHDRSIFQFMMQKHEVLTKDPSPYLMVVNTLDSHFYDGYIDKEYCGELQYPPIPDKTLPITLQCTDKILGDFYQYLKEHEAADNTLLVIASDHLFPAGGITSVLLNDHNRSNTFIIVDFENQESVTIEREGLAMDIAPTILNYLGWKIDRHYFGRNLLNPEVKTLSEELERSPIEIQELFSRWGILFSYFWLPKSSE